MLYRLRSNILSFQSDLDSKENDNNDLNIKPFSSRSVMFKEIVSLDLIKLSSIFE